MEPRYELAIFAGIGGGILGGALSGWKCVGAIERHRYAASILLKRQNEGFLPPFPIWTEVSTFRADNPECGDYISFLRTISHELVITAGFPCQDISRAGKGAGIHGDRSSLFFEATRIIGEIRPQYALLETSPVIVSRGLITILEEISLLGYDCAWGMLGADNAGAPHYRQRCWILAHSNRDPFRRIHIDRDVQSSSGKSKKQTWQKCNRAMPRHGGQDQGKLRHWPPEPSVGRLVDGFPYRLDAVERLGNAQVPRVARMAFDILKNKLLQYVQASP